MVQRSTIWMVRDTGTALSSSTRRLDQDLQHSLISRASTLISEDQLVQSRIFKTSGTISERKNSVTLGLGKGPIQ